MIQTWPLREEASIKHQKDFNAFLQVYGCDILFNLPHVPLLSCLAWHMLIGEECRLSACTQRLHNKQAIEKNRTGPTKVEGSNDSDMAIKRRSVN